MKSNWVIGLAVLLFISQALIGDRLRALEPVWVAPPHEQQHKWDPTLFRVLTFGHLPSAVDALWIRVISDPALSHVPEGMHAPIFYDLDLATDLDPENFTLYSSGSYLLTIVRDDDEGARDILKKGIRFYLDRIADYPREFRDRYWSSAFSLYLTLAYVYLYELSDMPSASAVFREASTLPNAPAYLASLKQRLERPEGEYEVALRLLEFMISERREDDEARSKLEDKRKSLYLSHLVRSLNRRFSEWRSAQGRRSGPIKADWERFRKEARVPPQDPWGGWIVLSSEGRVNTTTPREKVFGLE